jgi:hypothetical protein
MDPLECIKAYYDKNINLAPPQFMILNILSNFKKMENI